MGASAEESPRSAVVVIVLVSLVALSFLFWLIYLRERGGGGVGQDVSYLPVVNACLNSLSALCLALGIHYIRAADRGRHRRCMTAAFLFSSLFLMSYIAYHSLHGDSHFLGQGLLLRPVYFFILISHIGLSALTLPMVLATFFLSLSGRLAGHRRLARWTFPLWMYVSVTGVVIFAMLRVFGSSSS